MPTRRAISNLRVWLLAASLVLVFLGVLIVLGTAERADGTPILPEFGTAIVQMISSSGLVLAALLPVMVKLNRDTSVVREEVKNSHDSNFRVEQDERHDEILTKLNLHSKRSQLLDQRLYDLSVLIKERLERTDQRLERLERRLK